MVLPSKRQGLNYGASLLSLFVVIMCRVILTCNSSSDIFTFGHLNRTYCAALLCYLFVVDVFVVISIQFVVFFSG